jgi:uncharacterized protein YndB with AHSA1/START domain
MARRLWRVAAVAVTLALAAGLMLVLSPVANGTVGVALWLLSFVTICCSWHSRAGRRRCERPTHARSSAGGIAGFMGTALVTLAMLAILARSAHPQTPGQILAESTIDAPVDEVYAAWTTDDGLRAWLAPHAQIELRIGGLIRTNYDPQGRLGDPGTIENTILSFEPNRMLSIKVSKTPTGLPFATAINRMWTVIYFEPAATDRTRVRVVGLGFGPDDEDQRMRAFFEQGNQATLFQLQKYFADRPR